MPTILIYFPTTSRALRTVSRLKCLAENDNRSLSSYLRKVLNHHLANNTASRKET